MVKLAEPGFDSATGGSPRAAQKLEPRSLNHIHRDSWAPHGDSWGGEGQWRPMGTAWGPREDPAGTHGDPMGTHGGGHGDPWGHHKDPRRVPDCLLSDRTHPNYTNKQASTCAARAAQRALPEAGAKGTAPSVTQRCWQSLADAAWNVHLVPSSRCPRARPFHG